MVKISQSLIKNYVDVVNGISCGLLFKAKYIDKDPESQSPPSDAMKLGMFFEFLATGALPRDGVVPEPEMAYKGTARERMAIDYERASQSAELFKHIIHHYKIKILQVGMTLETDKINGIVDIYAEWNGKKVFIDLKYSGLLYDKWNEMGWDLESLPMKDSLMVQGVHYKILAKECLGIEDIPFYYFVFDSKNPKDAKIIKQTVDESRMQGHIVTVENVIQRLSLETFNALPSLKRCSECPIAHKCPKKVDYPLIDEVFY